MTQPKGCLKVVSSAIDDSYTGGAVVVINLVLEDEAGVRWVTEHEVFRFDLEKANAL